MAYQSPDLTSLSSQIREENAQRLKNNTRGTRLDMGKGSSDPYAGNLATDFNSMYSSDPNNVYRDYAGSNDRDVREGQRLTNEMSAASHGLDQGVDWNADQASLDAVKSRIGLKNSLAEQISGAPDMLNRTKSNLNAGATAAMSHGLQQTRENFNRRGLLYSGLREGGEQSVRGGIAGELASGQVGAERESANSVTAAKSAYGSVGLAMQQEQIQRASQAFETANANNIARLQAMQQLGQGVGYAGGMIAGSYANKTPMQVQPLEHQELSMPQMGSQYSRNGMGMPYNVDPNATNSWHSGGGY